MASKYKAVYLLSEGQIEGFAKATPEQSIRADGVPLKDSAGQWNFEGVAFNWRDGTPTQTYISGYESSTNPSLVQQELTYFGGPNDNHSVVIANSGANYYDAINIVLKYPNGVYTQDPDDGKIKKTTESHRVEVQANGSSVWVNVYDFNAQVTKQNSFEKTITVELPSSGGPWTFRVTNTNTTNLSYVSNTLIFERYERVVYGKFTYPNLAILAVSIDSDNFGTNIPAIGAEVKGIKVWVPKNYDPVARTYATTGPGTSGGIWDGTFKVAYTNNPVWAPYFDTLVNNRYGLGEYLNKDNNPSTALVNKWALYNISQYCDGMVPDGRGGTEPRFTFNARISSRQESIDYIRNILSVFRGMQTWRDNVIDVSADMPKTVSHIFTNQDVIDGNFEYSSSSIKNRASIYVVGYREKNNFYKEDFAFAEDLDAIVELGYKESQVTALGCTSRGQAQRLANWMKFTDKLQSSIVTFECGQKGAYVRIGDDIRIYDRLKQTTVQSGLAKNITSETISPTSYKHTITTVNDVRITDGTSYTLTVVDDTGNPVTGTLVSDFGSTGLSIAQKSLVFYTSSAKSFSENPVWALATSSSNGKKFTVVSVKEDKGKYGITAVAQIDDKDLMIDSGYSFDSPPESLISTLKLQAPTSVTIKTIYNNFSGAQAQAKVAVAWTAPQDKRITSYEVQMRTGNTSYETVYYGMASGWTSDILPILSDNTYYVRVRSLSNLTRTYSDFVEATPVVVQGKVSAPNAPTSISAVGIVGGVSLQWTNQSYPDFKHVEVWINSVDNSSTATKIAEVNTNKFTVSGLPDATNQYFWLKTVTHNPYINTSSFSDVSSAFTLSTASQQHTLVYPVETLIACDYTGAVKSGELPRVINVSRIKGSDNYDHATTFSTTFPSTITATINTTSNGPDRGNITVTAISSSSDFVVSTIADGNTLYAQLSVKKVLDAPPPPSSTTTSATISELIPIADTYTTSGTEGPILGPLTTDAGGTATLGARIYAKVGMTPQYVNREAQVRYKWQKSLTGTGAWTDVVSDTLAGTPNYSYGSESKLGDYELEIPIDVTVSHDITGLAANTAHYFRLILRKVGDACSSNGTRTVNIT